MAFTHHVSRLITVERNFRRCGVSLELAPIILHEVVGGEDTVHRPAVWRPDSSNPHHSIISDNRLDGPSYPFVFTDKEPIPAGGLRRPNITTILPSRSRMGQGDR